MAINNVFCSKRPVATLGDVSDIYFGHYENSAAYYGNGKPAIALAIQRELDADVIHTIATVEQRLTTIKQQYPQLRFEISDTQKETIVQSTENMFSSLRDSILMSIFVVFLFLASFRQMLVILCTIPLVFSTDNVCRRLSADGISPADANFTAGTQRIVCDFNYCGAVVIDAYFAVGSSGITTSRRVFPSPFQSCQCRYSHHVC
ncbi:MAG: hypothetical protein B6I37_09065 [Desulfobacteraceae bacterium 4572_35.2]|nr:MAG: hypothetical protein B6I37_09065 [Desulfobacteraceae bacterium 4572_35.2]